MKLRRNRVVAGLVVAALMIGCAETERNLSGDTPGAPGTLGGAPSGSAMPGGGTEGVATALPREERTAPRVDGVVLFVGTSLTAGYGLSPDQAFPNVIQRTINEAGLPFRVVNAGVSGETSAGALRRVEWLLQQPFDVVVLETGANDMLRGIDPDDTEENIQQIIDLVRERRPEARILLAGMLALPNLGPEYVRRFETIYPRLAQRNGLMLIPFLLDGVAADRALNLGDGIHPNPAGQRAVAATVWEVLEPVLREVAAS